MTILEDLKARGILKQVSNEEKFLKLQYTDAIYGGFDPTATSLHLGNYIMISTLMRFKKYGYKVYAIIGGATGMIGDPSFKKGERSLLTNDEVEKNKAKIKKQLESFGLEVLDNYDFYKNMNVLEFLRDAGKLVNVAYMMAKDSVATRIHSGLSFTEFSYQLLQGYDFLKLYQDYNVKLQVGGSDQWGNITTGLDMIAKIEGDDHKAVAMTMDLLTDESGNKIGKSTGGGSLWLDKEKTSPYSMYQYLYNQSDTMVEKLLNWLTFLDVNEIKEIMFKHNEAPFKRYAQERLAQEVIRDIFGQKELENAQKITKALFDKTFDLLSLNVDEVKMMEPYLKVVELSKNDNIIESLVKNNIIASNREAREFINTQALKLDSQIVDMDSVYNPQHFDGQYAFFQKGKKQIILLKTK